MEVWIATSNTGKINEFKSLLSDVGADLHSQGELRVFSQPPETGATFLENARIKARALKSVKSGVWVVADDSGLEVAGLNNFPGIHSARYAGPKASDAENNAKLLKMVNLRTATARQACFRCSLVAFNPSGEEFHFDGVLNGVVASQPKGNEGFGYDSLFIPEGETKTLAELGQAWKNRVSHRAQAIRKFKELLTAKPSEISTNESDG